MSSQLPDCISSLFTLCSLAYLSDRACGLDEFVDLPGRLGVAGRPPTADLTAGEDFVGRRPAFVSLIKQQIITLNLPTGSLSGGDGNEELSIPGRRESIGHVDGGP